MKKLLDTMFTHEFDRKMAPAMILVLSGLIVLYAFFELVLKNA